MSSRRSQAYFGKRGVHMKARRFVFTAASALFAMAVVASVRTQATGSAPDPAAVRQAALDAGLGSLAHVAPPDVPNLDQFLNPGPAAMQAALVLGTGCLTPTIREGSHCRSDITAHLMRCSVKRFLITACAAMAAIAAIDVARFQPVVGLGAQTPHNANVPKIPFDTSADFLKYSPDMNLGEVLGLAVNSKGHVVVLNHPGSSTSGPLYGNASTQLLEFDQNGKFVREIGKGVYGLGYSHSVRFDKYDNLWVVDKGTNAVVKFNPAGYVTMNLGRRPEGPDDHAQAYYHPGRREPPAHVDGLFRQPTDVAWDSDDNIYISDGYTNSRVAKFDKRGNWIKSWGSRGSGGQHADENPGQFNTPHNIGVDRQNNVYVADRGNRRIQVFDTDGRFLRMS